MRTVLRPHSEHILTLSRMRDGFTYKPLSLRTLRDSSAWNSCKSRNTNLWQMPKNQPYYTTSLIPHLYASPLKELIGQLKFHGNLSYSPLLAQSFVRSLSKRKHDLPECIIPVPLHKQRLQQRGFNQALELARIIAKQLQIPLDYTLCQRNKVTPFQSGLSAEQRKQNLRNAFNLSKAHHYKHVAIFDDVVTTGTTVNELAKQLKQSGVEIIEVWAIARTANKNH